MLTYANICHYNGDMPDKHVNVKIPTDLAKRLERATSKARDPYAPTQTAIILRGLELALREIEKR